MFANVIIQRSKYVKYQNLDRDQMYYANSTTIVAVESYFTTRP